MFNLEQTIAGWRKEMLAAGIESPAPLEELEAHLREEIERRTRSGESEPEAFSLAVQIIGQGQLLQREFGKAKPLNFNRILSVGTGLATLLVGLYQLWLLAVKNPVLEKLPGAQTELVVGVILAAILATALVVLGGILMCYGGSKVIWLPNTRSKSKNA